MRGGSIPRELLPYASTSLPYFRCVPPALPSEHPPFSPTLPHFCACALRRALELAKTHSVHTDTVLAHRQRFLDTVGRRETDAQFLALASSVKVDWDVIKVREGP